MNGYYVSEVQINKIATRIENSDETPLELLRDFYDTIIDDNKGDFDMEQKKSKYMDLGSMAHMMFAEKNAVLDSSFWGLCCAYATGAEPISNLDQTIDALENGRLRNYAKLKPDYEFNLEETVFNGHVLQFAKDLRSALENPGAPESQEFIDRLKNLSQLYYVHRANLPTNPAIRKAVGAVADSKQAIENMHMLMLNKFAKITDEKQKYDILKSFRQKDFGWGRIATRMVANSPYANPADLEYAIEVANNPAEEQAIFADIEKMSQKILTEELAKESPNMSRIQGTLTILRRRAHRINAETGERVDKEYDLDRLLKPDGAEYVQKLSAQETMQIAAMKKRLDYFVKNATKFRYDFTGLLKNYFGIADNPEYKWFCSRFVADILNAGRPSPEPYIVEPSLMKPEDFRYTTFAQYVTGGYLSNYHQKFVENVTKRILRSWKKR